jgi:hypothetical protein
MPNLGENHDVGEIQLVVKETCGKKKHMQEKQHVQERHACRRGNHARNACKKTYPW